MSAEQGAKNSQIRAVHRICEFHYARKTLVAFFTFRLPAAGMPPKANEPACRERAGGTRPEGDSLLPLRRLI